MSADAVDRVVEHWPTGCACGRRFADDERRAVGRPGRHQVIELPAIAVVVTEHQLMGVRCPGCGKRTAASLPADVPAGAFGPRLQAAIATLAIRNRVSRRDISELVRELFGARISTGAIDAIIARVGDALAQPYGDLLDHVRGASTVNIDETGWRLRGKQRALWAAVTSTAAVFRIAPDRHEREASELLGENFEGVVCSDRWWAYRGYDPTRRQVCWSHLIRDFTAQAEGLAAQKEFGEAGLDIAGRLFSAWQQFQTDADRRALRRAVAPLQRELKPVLTKYSSKSPRHKRTRGLARNLLKVWPALWTFATVPGVDPTNNAAERALRGPVIHRKLSLGSQSEAGEHTTQRLLTASVTCRLQRRSLFAYLSDLLTATGRHDPNPALV
jgi:transposase